MARKSCFLLLSLVGASTLSAAQQTSIDQIPNENPDIEIQIERATRSPDPSPQLSSGADSSSQPSQLSTEHSLARPPQQLSNEGKTAQAPRSLSRPSDGHQLSVDRLTGNDRCDPAEPSLPKATCRKVIENRAAEFVRPDANALSPEQRLLLEQEVRRGALDSQSGARRLSETGEADESLAAMGVAASVLRPKDEAVASKGKRDEDAAGAAEIVGAIIGQSLAPPPPR